MRRITPVLFAAMLAACSASEIQSDPPADRGATGGLALLDDARLALGEGDLDKAGQIYEQARQVEPENPELWVDIARLRFRRGEHLTAFDAADRALELDPNFAPALILRAQFTRDSHGAAESLPWFDAALSVDPSNPGVLADYAASLGDLGRYHDMLTVVRQLGHEEPGNSQVHYLQAVLAARAGNPLLAGSLLDRSGQARRGAPGAVMLGAIVDLQQGNVDSAAGKLELFAGSSAGQCAGAGIAGLCAVAEWT